MIRCDELTEAHACSAARATLVRFLPVLISCTGLHPTNDISIEFEIQSNFAMFLFITYLADHNKICRDVCKISLWSVQQNLNQSTPKFFYRNSNSIKISLVGRAPVKTSLYWIFPSCVLFYTRFTCLLSVRYIDHDWSAPWLHNLSISNNLCHISNKGTISNDLQMFLSEIPFAVWHWNLKHLELCHLPSHTNTSEIRIPS